MIRKKLEVSRKRAPDRRLERGRASDFIKPASDVLRPGDKVIVCCRVSGSGQQRKKNLDDQKMNLANRAAEFGAIVVGVVPYVGSGGDPYWLAKAAMLAKRHGAKLYAETTDRFMRHPGYHSNENPNVQARKADLEDLQWWAEGVTLVTDLHPDASPQEARRYHQARGQAAKGHKGGRPSKREWKRRRLARIKEAKRMRAACLSYREIAERLNALDDGFPSVCHGTIKNWERRVD